MFNTLQRIADTFNVPLDIRDKHSIRPGKDNKKNRKKGWISTVFINNIMLVTGKNRAPKVKSSKSKVNGNDRH